MLPSFHTFFHTYGMHLNLIFCSRFSLSLFSLDSYGADVLLSPISQILLLFESDHPLLLLSLFNRFERGGSLVPYPIMSLWFPSPFPFPFLLRTCKTGIIFTLSESIELTTATNPLWYHSLPLCIIICSVPPRHVMYIMITYLSIQMYRWSLFYYVFLVGGWFACWIMPLLYLRVLYRL